MAWETLPAWFWAVYYFFFLTALGTAAWCVVKKVHKWAAAIALLFSVTIPAVGMMKGIKRAEGMNEVDYFISQLQQGAGWSFYSVVGYLFLAGWMFIFAYKGMKRLIRAGADGGKYNWGE